MVDGEAIACDVNGLALFSGSLEYASFVCGSVSYTRYERTVDLLNAILAIGIVVAGVLGFLLFQGEVLIVILFGIPSIIVIGGALWLTHSLFVRFA